MVCEKIHSWHLASADDEINSARGCGSAMSTGHTPRFDRNESATNLRNVEGGKENTVGRRDKGKVSRENTLFSTACVRGGKMGCDDRSRDERTNENLDDTCCR